MDFRQLCNNEDTGFEYRVEIQTWIIVKIKDFVWFRERPFDFMGAGILLWSLNFFAHQSLAFHL